MTNILLVEDNADMLMMLTQVLEWGGYSVVSGRNGREGMKLLDNMGTPPDLVISDLLMPEMDGLEFLTTVRSTPQWSELPFVIMSAHSSSAERQSALATGADDFLVKPFNLDDFQKILSRWQGEDSRL